VSRITFGIGLFVVVAVLLRAVAVAIDARPGPLPPAGAMAAVVAQSLQTLVFLVAGSFLLVRFPNGREPGALSNAADVVLAVIAVGALLQAFIPGPLDFEWLSDAVNPIGLPILGGAVAEFVRDLALAAYVVGLVLTVVVSVRRYRGSDAVTRAQIRWVGAAGLVPLALLPAVLLVDWMWSVWLISTTVLPIAIGMAILRYHLYEIDRIIGRTLAYAIVTALLAGVVVGANLLFQTAVAGATGDSPLVVAVSTLLVAALFQPFRRRVQVPVDRRFNRSAVNAERAVLSFTRRTRDEVDLARLREAVVRTAAEAVAPASAGLWLRAESGPGTQLRLEPRETSRGVTA
jgi:hypothetical protein